MRILQYPNALDNAMLMEDLSLFKNIWLLIYSLLFASGYSMLNLKYNKQKTLAEVQMGINFILGALFMTLGLYYFSELRERYISEAARGYQLSLWFLNIRYLGIIAFAGLCYTIWQLQKFLNLSAKSKLKLELLLHLVALWVSSSELLHWTELYESSSNYKLGLTILWGAYAVLLLVLGLFKKKKYLRISGIVLISFSVLKLFFYDITHLDTLRKTIVFVSLGVLMLIASFLYNKYTKEIDEDKEEKPEDNSAQFDRSDTRTLDEIVDWLLGLGYVPSFCTACYRAGRTGDRFMALAKSGQIHNCCQPNALMTLNEYIMDYGDEKTKKHGAKVIEDQLENIKNDMVKDKAKAYIAQMEDGKRDFRF